MANPKTRTKRFDRYQWDDKNGVVKQVSELTEKEAKTYLCDCMDIISKLGGSAEYMIHILEKNKF